MLLKIALTVAVIGAVWIFMFRASGGRQAKVDRPAPRPVESLEKCEKCGTYRAYGDPCKCAGQA